MSKSNPSEGVYDQLLEAFNIQVASLKALVAFRGRSLDDDLEALSVQLSRVESLYSTIRSQVNSELEWLPKVTEMTSAIERQSLYLSAMNSALPTRLPGSYSAPPPQAPTPKKEERSTRAAPGFAFSPATTPKFATMSSSSSGGGGFGKENGDSRSSMPPRMDYVTVDELKNISSYMRGRLTLDKINGAIDEAHALLDKKYKAMAAAAAPGAKGRAALTAAVKNWKMEETLDTKGVFFWTSGDMKMGKVLKIDGTGKSVLQVLRHLGRIREIRGEGVVRYAVN